MSFDFSTLVTDRTQADVNRVKEIADKIKNGTASESELAEFNSAAMKGAYNYTDLNRVTAAMEDLKLRLEGYGYVVPGYQRIQIPYPVTGGGSRLPDGYTELAWIESTGTQYIDTGFKPNQDTQAVMDFELTYSYSSIRSIFGVRDTENGYAPLMFNLWNDAATRFRSDYFGTQKTITVSTILTKTNVNKNKNVTTIDGTSVTNTAATGQCALNLYLFALNNAGSAGYHSPLKLYSCQIYDNGTLVRDYVPCRNPYGGVGLFDLVNAQFYGNAGTGGFVGGTPLVEVALPDGYTKLNYIESTGTQYIDTGVKPSVGTQAVVDFQATSTPTSNWWILSAVTSGTVLWRAGVNSSTFRTDAGFTYSQTSSLTARTVATGTCSVNMSIPLYLFAQNEGGAVESGKFKLYSCQIYDNGTLVRDYIPCISSNGVVGLYDLVTATFFGNSGTGSFIAGDTIIVPSNSVSMTNLIADGSFETTNTWSTWSTDALVTEQAHLGTKSLKLTGDQLAQIPVERPIVGHKYYAREYIKTDGEVTIGDGRFEVHGGDGVGLNWVYGWNRGNYPDWTIQSDVHKIEAVNAISYVLRTFKVGGSGTAYVDGVMLIDLTASFGAGFEPDKEWCDTYIPFFEGTQFVELPPRYEWKEYDVPTTGQMVSYLQNVAVIRSVLAVMASTPNTPDNMVGLMVKEANDIEVILMDVYRQINIMATTFIPCGEALSGGDNL